MKRILNKSGLLLVLLMCLFASSKVQAQITTFLPNPITAGTTTILTITGTGFGVGGPNATMYVEFRNADDGGATFIQPLPSEYVSWSTTQILVRVPSDAGTGVIRVRNGGSTFTSGSNLTISYDILNVTSGGIAYMPDHINKQAGGYTWQMFTGFDANAAANASFKRALETWRCATFINWGIGTPTTTDAIASDGINIVRFDKAGQELPAGVLGRCTSRWTSCNTGSTWEWWVYELDIEFDQATAWQFGPALPGGAQYDFESVAVHELGHGHQLGHVINPADVMHYSIANGSSLRTLIAGDVNGGLSVMARSTAANNCPVLPMVALAAGNCRLSCTVSPSNDAICSATVAPVNGTCLTTQTNYCSNADLNTGCLTSNRTVWYRYTLTGGNNKLSITFPTSTFGGGIETALYSGACGTPTAVGSQCGLPTDTYAYTNLTPGGTYFLAVSTLSGLEGDFSICATQSIDPCVVPPANDAICSATVLPVNGTCVTAQNNCPATADYNLGCAVSNKTLWYSLTLTGSNDQVSITFANTAAGFGPNVDLQLYSGACATPVAVAAKCGTKLSTFTFTGLTAGVTYRLGVSTDAAYTGLFDICAIQSINPCTGNAPANDLICNAAILPVNGTCLTAQRNTCSTADYTSGCSTTTNTVWYRFNLTGLNTVMTINYNNQTFGAGGAVQMILASGACGTPTMVSTYCGLTGGNIRFTNLSTLTTYYVSVSTDDGNQGTFDICGDQSVDCGVSTPINDAMCSATNLAVNGTCLAGQTNLCATPDVYGGCVAQNAPSVYYNITISGVNNAVNITFPTNTFSGNVQTYLFAGPCTSYTGMNSFCGTATTTFSYTNLPTGNYILMVATDSANTADFTICATQYQTPPGTLTGPMQDCNGAIPMCGASYQETNSYIGFGNQELAGTCLGTNETNSVWYSFSPQIGGTFAFNLSTLNDYDFAVYDLTSFTCADIPTLVPLRCNWSGTPGNTGLTLPPAPNTPALNEGGAGVPTMPGLTVAAGSRYVIVVDNYSADNNGYQLTFTGTAQIFDNAPPTVSTVNSCINNTITLNFNEPIVCDSIFNNEFTLYHVETGTNYTTAITSVLGSSCAPGAFTSQVVVSHNGAFPSGDYRLTTVRGSLQDACGNRVAAGLVTTFSYLQDIFLTSNVSAICASGNPVVLTASGGPVGSVYTLNPGGLTNSTNVLDINGNIIATDGVFTVNPFSTTQYTVSTTTAGCTKSKNLTITLVNNVIAAVDPVNVSICSGTTTLNASATVNGVPCPTCSFQWSGGSTATTPSITVGAGTYNVVATTIQGCPGTNTASSTVTVATAGVTPNCNIYYVSPGGTGSGLLKTDPTSLQNALALALCQTAIIKMQTGIYTLTDKVDVNSFITIEGGYDAAFLTKSSNMTGGTNSTTIRRTNATDSDNINTCTGFRVVSGANGFLFQDLRIEMPGSSAITGHTTGLDISNYGIKIGAGCTGYNIVRCYIDAGRGSN